MNWSGGRSPQGVFIDYHRERQPILEYYRVNAAIREALKPRVELPSGGYIIIEPTEALTVIDVNSGSFTRSATSRETVLWTNSEAATEIARQLRLRNIGGVIIVDFIDMDSRRDQLKLLEHFNKTIKGDKARPQIAQLSELGLVELTRKRQGKNIYELFGQTCPTCAGLGHLAHLPGKFEGESLETPPVTPLAVVPSIIEKYTPESEFAEQPLDYGYESSPQQLELINHPNYQDQVSVGNGSRRRRRRRLNELLMKEELGDSEVATSRELDSEPSNYEERKPRTQTSRASRRDETSWEKVSVEMTDLEQEVYALMGVSPLVRLDRELKDSKSVFVYVKTPEEINQSSNKSESVEEQSVTVEPVQQEEETDSVTDDDNGEAYSGRRRRRRRSSAQKEITV
jgi:ribonuclease E